MVLIFLDEVLTLEPVKSLCPSQNSYGEVPLLQNVTLLVGRVFIDVIKLKGGL